MIGPFRDEDFEDDFDDFPFEDTEGSDEAASDAFWNDVDAQVDAHLEADALEREMRLVEHFGEFPQHDLDAMKRGRLGVARAIANEASYE